MIVFDQLSFFPRSDVFGLRRMGGSYRSGSSSAFGRDYLIRSIADGAHLWKLHCSSPMWHYSTGRSIAIRFVRDTGK